MALRERLRSDVRAVIDRDPATERALEVLLTSPGLYARWSHRFAHWLWNREHRLLARVLATIARLLTGIEIHPGAELGERVVIDHGQGLVIGSTATVGDDVLFYHGVTLGARDEREGTRHPTVGDDATLGANATVLGNIVVGDGATVGAGAVVLDPVAPDDTVVGVPAEPVDGDASESTDAASDRSPTDSEDVAGTSGQSPVQASTESTTSSNGGDGSAEPARTDRSTHRSWHRQDSCDDVPATDGRERQVVATNGGEPPGGATAGDADGRNPNEGHSDQSERCRDDGTPETSCEASGS